MMSPQIRSMAVVLYNSSLLTLLVPDPENGKSFYHLPGGKIEEHETAPESAERETLEKTGYIVRAEIEFVIDKEYSFHWQGKEWESLTFFFRSYLINPMQQIKVLNNADCNKKIIWLPQSEIEKSLSYSLTIQQAVMALLSY